MLFRISLIAGFVVPAGAGKRVLVRAVGPGLTPFGVTGVLAQPVLQLQSGSTVVAQNTNWTTSADRDAITAGSSQSGAFALSAGDSALIATLAPGNYTVLVTGVGATSGIALIVVNINIDYRHPATMNDELVIETSVKSVGNRSSALPPGRTIRSNTACFAFF